MSNEKPDIAETAPTRPGGVTILDLIENFYGMAIEEVARFAQRQGAGFFDVSPGGNPARSGSTR